MSVKIWTAYRIKRKRGIDPWETCIRLQREATERARKALWDLYVNIEVAARTDAKFRKETGLENVNLPTGISRFVLKRYEAQLGDVQRNLYHLDVSFTVRRVSGRYLIIPYVDGLMRDVFQPLARDEHLEDYHYQDQVGRPEQITASEWRRRRDTWEAADKEWNLFATFEVLNFDGFFQVDPVWHRDYMLSSRWDRDVAMEIKAKHAPIRVEKIKSKSTKKK